MTRQRPITFLLLLVALVLFAPYAAADSLRYVDLDDQVYRFLEYARTGGYLRFLPRVRPYTTADVVEMLEEIAHSARGEIAGQQPHSRAYRNSVWVLEQAEASTSRLVNDEATLLTGSFGEAGSIEIGSSLAVDTKAVLNRLGDSIPSASLPITLAIAPIPQLYVATDVIPTIEYWNWEQLPYPRYQDPLRSDYYMYTQNLDTGRGSFNHDGSHSIGTRELVTTVDTVNQFTIDAGIVRVDTGRAALDWGPSPVANLILSGTAKPYDHLALTMPLGGSGTFSWVTAILQDFAFESGDTEERLLTAHRVGFQVTDWLYLSLYESVIYDFGFELAYLNPLSFYYVTEITQGTDDNKLGGADFIVNLPNVEIYGSFFADDWDANRPFSLNASHNEWAGILGTRYVGLLPGLTLTAELVYVSHWMYTHFSWQSATEVGRSYQHYGSNLGHFLDQNSWMGYLGGRYDMLPGTWFESSFQIVQDGRGDIDTPPDWSEETELHGEDSYRDITYSFLDRGKPGFQIDTTFDWSVSGHHSFPGTGIAIDAGYTFQASVSQATEDMSRVPGSELVEHFLSLGATWSPGALMHR